MGLTKCTHDNSQCIQPIKGGFLMADVHKNTHTHKTVRIWMRNRLQKGAISIAPNELDHFEYVAFVSDLCATKIDTKGRFECSMWHWYSIDTEYMNCLMQQTSHRPFSDPSKLAIFVDFACNLTISKQKFTL